MYVLMHTFQEELALLHDSANDAKGRSRDHELRTAPIVTRDAYVAAGYRDNMTQYGVLGRALHILYVSAALLILAESFTLSVAIDLRRTPLQTHGFTSIQ